MYQIYFLDPYFTFKFIKLLLSYFNFYVNFFHSYSHHFLVLYSDYFHWILTFCLDISGSFSRSRLVVKLYHILAKFFKLLGYALQLLFPPFCGSIFLLFLLNSNIFLWMFRVYFFIPTYCWIYQIFGNSYRVLG